MSHGNLDADKSLLDDEAIESECEKEESESEEKESESEKESQSEKEIESKTKNEITVEQFLRQKLLNLCRFIRRSSLSNLAEDNNPLYVMLKHAARNNKDAFDFLALLKKYKRFSTNALFQLLSKRYNVDTKSWKDKDKERLFRYIDCMKDVLTDAEKTLNNKKK